MESLVGYARHISNVDSAREGDLRVPKPERPPSRSHPVGHGKSVTSSMCNTVDFCLYAAVSRVGRCADLVPVCFGVGRGTLCRFIFIYCVFWALGRMYIRFYCLLSAVEFSAGDVATVWAAAEEV